MRSIQHFGDFSTYIVIDKTPIFCHHHPPSCSHAWRCSDSWNDFGIRISYMPSSENTVLYFPYSILLSGLGTLLAIVSWVMAFVMYHKSRKQDCQNPYLRMEETRDCPITEQSSGQANWQYIQFKYFWRPNSLAILRWRNILNSFDDLI